MTEPIEKPRRAMLLPVLLGVLAVYLCGAVWFAQPRSVWSPDCGARLVQIQSILQHPPEWWITYPAENLDPQHQNSPLSFYESSHGGRQYVFYSFVFALLTAPLFSAFGYLGLALLPVLGGVGTVAATYLLARRLGARYPVAPALLLGLVTPVALYSVVFWDHAVLAAIATGALYLVVVGAETNRGRLWLAAGLLLGAGVWLHEILAPYLPALVVGGWWLRGRHSGLRNGALLIAGFLLFVVPLAWVNAKVYGSPLGPHLSNNRLGSGNEIASFLLKPDEWGPGALYTLFGWGDTSPGFTWQLKEWLVNPGAKFQRELTASAWMAVPILVWMVLGATGWWRRSWPLTCATVLGLCASAVWVLRHPDWPHSPFLACPLLLVAFCAPLRREAPSSEATVTAADDSARLGIQAVAMVTLLYTLINLLKPTLGGTEWGSRHLLSIYPALIVIGWLGLERLLPATGEAWRPGARPILSACAVLAAFSLALLVHGSLVVHRMHVNNRAMADTITGALDDVVVSTSWWAPMNGAPSYYDKRVVYAGDPEHPAPPLFQRLKEQGVQSYTLIGFHTRDLWAYSSPVGYMPMPGSDRHVSLGLVSARYVLMAPKPSAPVQQAPPTDSGLPPSHQLDVPSGSEVEVIPPSHR